MVPFGRDGDGIEDAGQRIDKELGSSRSGEWRTAMTDAWQCYQGLTAVTSTWILLQSDLFVLPAVLSVAVIPGSLEWIFVHLWMLRRCERWK